MIATTEEGLFDGGPPRRLEHGLRFSKPGSRSPLRRAVAVVLVGWVPLVLLTLIQSFVLDMPGIGAFLFDFGAQARSLFAVPILVFAHTLCTPRLNGIAQHFVVAGLVDDKDRPRFDAAVASTRRLLDSTVAEVVVVILAYVSVAALTHWAPAESLAAWSWTDTHGRTMAGLWNSLVSLPLLLVFLIGWMWRLALWTRFLWLMGRLDLLLVAAHPDHTAGLAFVGYSVRAFSPVALAIGTIVAGAAANHVVNVGLPAHAAWHLVGTAAVTVVLFCCPLLTLCGPLLAERRRGAFEYGALAQRMGQNFEAKWLHERGKVGRGALEAPDFSATTDLYQVVANAYAMKLVPLDRKNVLVLIAATLLPFLPVALTAVPVDEILSRMAHFLL